MKKWTSGKPYLYFLWGIVILTHTLILFFFWKFEPNVIKRDKFFPPFPYIVGTFMFYIYQKIVTLEDLLLQDKNYEKLLNSKFSVFSKSLSDRREQIKFSVIWSIVVVLIIILYFLSDRDNKFVIYGTDVEAETQLKYVKYLNLTFISLWGLAMLIIAIRYSILLNSLRNSMHEDPPILGENTDYPSYIKFRSAFYQFENQLTKIAFFTSIVFILWVVVVDYEISNNYWIYDDRRVILFVGGLLLPYFVLLGLPQLVFHPWLKKCKIELIKTIREEISSGSSNNLEKLYDDLINFDKIDTWMPSIKRILFSFSPFLTILSIIGIFDLAHRI